MGESQWQISEGDFDFTGQTSTFVYLFSCKLIYLDTGQSSGNYMHYWIFLLQNIFFLQNKNEII